MDGAAPHPSSTLVLLREEPQGDEPFSVLMLERHGSIPFPGAHVFPGGLLDADDAGAPGAELPPSQRWAPVGEGDRPPDALAYWVAAVREVFEEVGILLAARAGRLVEGPLPPDLRALRARLHAGERFGPLLAEAGLVPATAALFYFARWITPVIHPRRWDTRFLVGRAPPGQEAVVDGAETVSCTWLGPRAALAAYEAGRIVLIPPTVRTLDDLARFSSIDAVLADAARRVVRAATPEIVAPPRPLVLRDGRWRLRGR